MLCFVVTRAFMHPAFLRSSGRNAMSLHATSIKPELTDLSVSTLRSMNLYDQDGNVQNLGEKMGNDRAVVVFLRHLG